MRLWPRVIACLLLTVIATVASVQLVSPVNARSLLGPRVGPLPKLSARTVLSPSTLLLQRGSVRDTDRPGAKTLTQSLHATAPTQVLRTQVQTFEPFDSRGKLRLGLRVRATVRGTCFLSAAIPLPRPDMWECLPGGSPCFQNPTGVSNTVACAPDPSSGTVTLVRSRRPLYRRRTPTRPRLIWALILASGEHCGLVHTTLMGEPFGRGNLGAYLHYACGPAVVPGSPGSRNQVTAYVYGDVDQRVQPWTVRVWRKPHTTPTAVRQLSRMAVRRAWR